MLRLLPLLFLFGACGWTVVVRGDPNQALINDLLEERFKTVEARQQNQARASNLLADHVEKLEHPEVKKTP